MDKPLIFITNDDSIYSKGIASLVEAASLFGDVLVIAPNKAQSGMGHAITINDPLRLEKTEIWPGIDSYSCSGTPVDCVKLGIYEILHRKPDLLLSGINHGSNAATNVLYSGTMSAAVEGALEGIPSIGFSYDDYAADADFDLAKKVVKSVIENTLKSGLPNGVCLNVNIPKVIPADHKGIIVCRQAHAYWDDRFDKRQDQFGRTYYWLTGDFNQHEPGKDTDLYHLSQGFSTIVPTQFDLTAHQTLEALKVQFS